MEFRGEDAWKIFRNDRTKPRNKEKSFVSEITARSRMHDRVDRIIIHSKSLASLQRTDPAKIALNTLSLSFIKFFPNVLIRSKECLSPFPSLLSIFSTGERSKIEWRKRNVKILISYEKFFLNIIIFK